MRTVGILRSDRWTIEVSDVIHELDTGEYFLELRITSGPFHTDTCAAIHGCDGEYIERVLAAMDAANRCLAEGR